MILRNGANAGSGSRIVASTTNPGGLNQGGVAWAGSPGNSPALKCLILAPRVNALSEEVFS
jgi:hypothetical protein